jgi:hypothetical protein
VESILDEFRNPDTAGNDELEQWLDSLLATGAQILPSAFPKT